MPHVVIGLYPAALASSITLPMEILQAAAGTVMASSRQPQAVTIDIAATELIPVTTSSGITLTPTITFDHAQQADLLLLPAMWRNPLPNLRREKSIAPLVRKFAARDAIVCAVGTASYFLAESGVLDHRAATTHWHYFDKFSERYPAVDLKRQHLITQSRNIYCAGSVNSVADLMIHITQQWFGTSISRRVERQFSPEIRRPFEAHAYLAGGQGSSADELVTSAQEWLMGHAGASVYMTALAQHLGVSQRTLNRRFHAATGVSPLDFLTRYRVTSARDMLRTTDLDIAEIAYLCGYGDASHFAQVFNRHSGSTPRVYRQSVRGKLFSAQADKLGATGI